MKRYLALPLLTLTILGCDAMTAHTDVVARVEQYQLTVDEAGELLAGNPQIPSQTEVIGTIAGLWVDYTILADMATEDSTLAELDLAPMIEPYVEQQVFLQLRDQVITPDTVISDEELAELYAEEGRGTRVRARHVLLSIPDGASEEERDSVYALAEGLRERAAGGEDFAAMAREYSDDSGTAQQGGDLGWFERGDMVEPFEEAAFALEGGEVSGVVETPYGLHIIKVEERETQSLEEAGETFRRQVISQRQQESLNSYVEGLREPRDLEIQRGAEDVARDLAESPSTPLQQRAASRELVSWGDGSLTAGELAKMFQRVAQPQRMNYAELEDEPMAELLRDLATNELVLADARERGISVPVEEQDSIEELIRSQLGQMVQGTGLTGPPQEGETEAEAVQRRVGSFISGILSGQRNMLPLGALPQALRAEVEWQVNERTFPEVLEQLEAQRSGPAEAPAADSPSQPVPDTAG